MTLINEVDFPNALSEYCRTNAVSAIVDDDNCWQLHPTQQQLDSGNDRIGYTSVSQFDWNHPTLAKPTATQLITAHDNLIAENALAEATHQQSITVENGAKTQAASIPNWAGWTEAQALSWHDTNVQNAIAPIANLTDAKAVLTQMATENRALVRMVIALRNKAFPDLQE